VNRRGPYDDFRFPDAISQVAERWQRWSERFSSGAARWLLRGVVMLFGRAVEQTEPGLRYRFPSPIQSHELVDIAQVRRAEIGFRSGATASAGRPVCGDQTMPQDALMLTGDEKIKEREILLPTAYETSQKISGEGDAEAAGVDVQAFGKDPDFYGFIRRLQTYENTLGTGTTMVLPSDSDLLQYLQTA
jgi:regulator of protease activity HflC (stomatin/prohibitin superfamily)